MAKRRDERRQDKKETMREAKKERKSRGGRWQARKIEREAQYLILFHNLYQQITFIRCPQN